MSISDAVEECLFCKMVSGQIPVEKLIDNENVMAFRDINPQAPQHFLIIARRHISTLNDLQESDAELIGRMHLAAASLAKKHGLAERGYRTVFNCNRDAGQAVFHIHLHLLGGRKMGWPPG
jgi:histidine triad (HIT) family protein